MSQVKLDPSFLLGLADERLFLWLNHKRHPLLDRLLPYFSDERFIYAFFGLFALILLFNLRWRGLLVVIFAWLLVLGSDFLCARVLKPYFGRPRPFLTHGDIYLYRHHQWQRIEEPLSGRSYTLPSCHATNVSCAAASFSFLIPRFAPLFWAFALTVGYSRVYLGVHYPFDVLLGFVVGWLVGYLGRLILTRFLEEP